MNTTHNRKIGFVIAGLLLGILIAAMDNTIVATAMGTIVGDLGGMDKFVWVTSAYLVASMAGMPIFGKLSDMYGRKRFFVFGLIVFLIGSMLCGLAHTIIQLSIYRAIQGIGGGALMPIAFTIVFDMYPPEKRGKMSGLFGAVFGVSSLFGPLLGAYITDHISWQWIFYINVPLGILSLIFVVSSYKESLAHRKQKIDWFGAITLVGAVICLMFALELGGNSYAWDSAQIIGLFVAFAVLTIAFVLIERKASEPIISFKMFKERLFVTSSFTGFFYGVAFIVATIYIPIFVQGVFGGTATNSGLILLPMTLSSVVAAQIGGQLSTKLRFRDIMIFSVVIFTLGTYLLSTISPDTSHTMLAIFMIVLGFGTGFSFSVLSMSAIQNFDIRQRGSANSSFTFLRTLGMTLGITIFGILQRNTFTDKLADAFKSMGGAAQGHGNFGNDPRALLQPAVRAHIPPQILDKISDALSTSIAHTFLWAILPAVLAIVCVFLMGNARVQMPSKVKAKAEPKA